jgi:hypothetical protein
MTGSWLRQMGWKDVFVLPEAGNETPSLKIIPGTPAADRAISARRARDRRR